MSSNKFGAGLDPKQKNCGAVNKMVAMTTDGETAQPSPMNGHRGKMAGRT